MSAGKQVVGADLMKLPVQFVGKKGIAAGFSRELAKVGCGALRKGGATEVTAGNSASGIATGLQGEFRVLAGSSTVSRVAHSYIHRGVDRSAY